jgi:hypothetical protein
MAKALKIGLPEAKQAIVVLQLQGYIEPAGQTGKWRITEQGDLVSVPNRPDSRDRASTRRLVSSEIASKP